MLCMSVCVIQWQNLHRSRFVSNSFKENMLEKLFCWWFHFLGSCWLNDQLCHCVHYRSCCCYIIWHTVCLSHLPGAGFFQHISKKLMRSPVQQNGAVECRLLTWWQSSPVQQVCFTFSNSFLRQSCSACTKACAIVTGHSDQLGC